MKQKTIDRIRKLLDVIEQTPDQTFGPYERQNQALLAQLEIKELIEELDPERQWLEKLAEHAGASLYYAHRRFNFNRECPITWSYLMTTELNSAVTVEGTRHISGNGSIDGRLLDCYKELLPWINKRRTELGLKLVV